MVVRLLSLSVKMRQHDVGVGCYRCAMFWFLLLLPIHVETAGRFPGDDQYVEGTVFTLHVPASQAAGLLPAGLELAPLPNTNSARSSLNASSSSSGDSSEPLHPIAFTFCTQFNVGSPFTHFTYKEFILTVPYVQWDDAHAPSYPNYRGPFAYLPHLFLNESEPVDLGHSYVGDRKELAAIALGLDRKAGSGSFVVTGVNASHWTPDGGSHSHDPDAPTGAFPGEVILSAQWNASGLNPEYSNASEWCVRTTTMLPTLVRPPGCARMKNLVCGWA